MALLCSREALPAPHRAVPDVVRRGELDQRVALVQQRTGIAQGLLGTLAVNSGYLSGRERLRVFAELARRTKSPSPRLLLSAGVGRRARGLRVRSAALAEQWGARGR